MRKIRRWCVQYEETILHYRAVGNALSLIVAVSEKETW
jgi:hypothetical protein